MTTNSDSKSVVLESISPEFMTDENMAVLDQLEIYKKTLSIYERTQIILGKKKVYGEFNSTTDNAILNLNQIGTTTGTSKISHYARVE